MNAHSYTHIRSRSGSRDGVALIMVLAFIVLLTILVVSFVAFNKLNRISTASYSKSVQAQEIAQGGLQDILSDLHQEIIAGSYTNTTIFAPNGGPMIYVPTTNYTAMPARVGYDPTSWGNDIYSPAADDLSPTLVRVSRVSQTVGKPLYFYPSFSTNTALYDKTLAANLINRASAANTATPSANGRSITAARWNKTFLLAPTTDTNSVANQGLSIPGTFATNYTSLASGGSLDSGSPPPYGPPDWVYVTRTGSRVCDVTADTMTALLPSSNLSANYGTTTPGANPPASPVIGRYAYVMYDESALIDMNVAGFTTASSNMVSSPADPTTGITQAINGKSYLSYADLTRIGFKPQSAVNAFVQWRNASSASSGNTYLNAVFSSYAKNGFLSFLANDSPFLSRQDLINYFTNLDGVNFNTINTSYICLPYMGTFTRDVNTPSYSPPVNASVLGGSASAIYNYHDNAEISTASPFSSTSPNPNRDLANLRWPTAFPQVKHYDDTGTSTTYAVNAGDPFLQSRFSLAKINLLAATAPATGPAPSSTNATAIQACFGLSWGNPGLIATSVNNTANGGNPCWNYVGGTGSSPVATIETLDQVAAEGREPNFFEFLKAAILSGSIGLSPGPAAFSNGTDPKGWGYDLHSASVADFLGPGGLFSYSYDGNTSLNTNPTVFAPASVKDVQIIQIGANIIDQFDADSYPTAIYFPYFGVGVYDPVNGSKANPIYGPVDMVYGDENLPYLTKITEFDCSTNPMGATNPTDDTDAYTAANGGTVTLSGFYQPELWNPHQEPASLPNVPKNFQIRAYGSVELSWTWGNTNAKYNYGNSSAAQENWLTANSNADNNSFATINFTDNSATSSFYAHPFPLTSDSIPAFGSSTVVFPVATVPGDTTKNDPLNIAQPNYPYYTANSNLDHFVAFWAGTTPATDPGAGSFRPFWTDHSSNAQNAYVVPTISVNGLQCNTFALGWVDSVNGFHPYSFISGAFDEAYNTMYARSPEENANGSVNCDSVAPSHWLYADPRTSRFSLLVNYFSGQQGPPNGETYFFNSTTGHHHKTETGVPNASGFNPASTPAVYPEDWAVNQSTITATTGVVSPATYYADPDGVVRPGDGLYANTATGDGLQLFGPGTGGAGTGGTAKGDTTATGNGTGNTQHGRRPVILNRPFRSVGELGYAFRDEPFKTLDFFTQYSADAALLDVFSITDEAKVANNSLSAVVAGRFNPSNAPSNAIKAILSGSLKKEDFDPTYNINTEVSGLGTKVSNQFQGATSLGPLMSRADLVTRLMPKNLTGIISGFTTKPDQCNKPYFESAIRALADVTNIRTWNLMIDIIAQSGHMSPNATTLDNFIVEGEKRYWLHIAIDRYTGKIIDQQLEPVYE